ncbi:MAG: putative PDDEXK endonuclease [Candidatus Heimdallarchaeaceae archaeon]
MLNRNLTNSEFRRVPGSGALGTIMNESRLTGDVKGKVSFLSKEFNIEAKTGYGGSKQLAIKKEWFDKCREEAENDYSIPLLACKFSNARVGVKHFIAMDFEAFTDIMEEANKLYEDVIKLQEKLDAKND